MSTARRSAPSSPRWVRAPWVGLDILGSSIHIIKPFEWGRLFCEICVVVILLSAFNPAIRMREDFLLIAIVRVVQLNNYGRSAKENSFQRNSLTMIFLDEKKSTRGIFFQWNSNIMQLQTGISIMV